MQEYKRIMIGKDEVVPLAQKMRQEGVVLAMIHGYPDEAGKPVISYEYQIGEGIESYTVTGEPVLPSISAVYDKAAEWPERELMELMDITFEGIDTSKRLFLPETMFEEEGQILVTPMAELTEKAHKKEEA